MNIPDIPDTPKISKPLHIYAIVFWAASLLFVLLSVFFDLTRLFGLVFIVILVEMFWSEAYRRGNAMALTKGGNDPFSRIVYGVGIVAAVLFVVTFFAIFPGTPDIVDGAYVRTSHGDIVATLTQQEWQWLSLCERLSWAFICLVFSSTLLSSIHALYLKQHPHEKSGPDNPSVRS